MNNTWQEKVYRNEMVPVVVAGQIEVAEDVDQRVRPVRGDDNEV